MEATELISRPEHEEFVRRMEAENDRLDDENKRQNRRLELLEGKIQENAELVVSIKELALETKHMREDLNSTVQRIDRLENMNGDKWDKFKWLIVAGLVTVILGYLAVSIGLK